MDNIVYNSSIEGELFNAILITRLQLIGLICYPNCLPDMRHIATLNARHYKRYMMNVNVRTI